MNYIKRTSEWLHTVRGLNCFFCGSSPWLVRIYLKSILYIKLNLLRHQASSFFFCTSINSRVYSVHFTESGDMATFPVNNLKRFVTCSSGNESINNWPLKWLDKNKLLWIFYSYHLPGEQNGHVVVQWVFVSFHVELLLPLTEAVQAVVSVVRYLQFILSSTGNVGRKRRKQSVNTSKTQHCSWTLIGEQSCCWSAAKIETTRSIW